MPVTSLAPAARCQAGALTGGKRLPGSEANCQPQAFKQELFYYLIQFGSLFLALQATLASCFLAFLGNHQREKSFFFFK